MRNTHASESMTRVFAEFSSMVGGSPAYALVPRDGVMEVLEGVGFREPIHLFVPGETELGEWKKEGSLKVCSINVQPGRGTTSEDWHDCEEWLAMISDVTLTLVWEVSESKDVAAASETNWIYEVKSGTFHGGSDFTQEASEESNDQKIVDDLFGGGSMPDDLDEIKSQASIVAARCAPWFRFLESGSLFLNISPSVILAIAAALSWADDMKAIWKFTAALMATLAALGLKHVRSRRRWLHGRAVAEICRSIKYTDRILDPLFPPAAKYLPQYASLIRSMTLSLSEKKGKIEKISVFQEREGYLSKRLGGENGQIQYFSHQAQRAQARRKLVKSIFYGATVIALVSTVLALLCHLGWLPISSDFNKRWISGFATFAFPALAAAAIGYLGLSETARRADYYEEMVRLLKEQELIISRLQSESSLMEAIRQTESLLLEEFAGWLRRRIY